MPNLKNKNSPSALGNSHEWFVISTSLSEGWLILHCKKTDKIGYIKNPSKKEWAEAFCAPENPYRWFDNSRVISND